MAQLVVSAPLEKLFQSYYRWTSAPASGELEYKGAEGLRTIRFNARNLAFDILYADLFARNYEDETAVLLDAFLPKGGCFYDIGSNWGYFSLYAASRGAAIRIHAFEPIPGTFEDLRCCVEQAGLGGQVRCHNLAASDSDREMIFQLPLHSACAQVGTDVPSAGSEVKVRTARLDSLDIEPPDFVKIDAEGHERSVLKGSLETLRKSRPFIMFENKLYRNKPQETLHPLLLLQELRYQVFVPTVKRLCDDSAYLVNCGYQIDTGRMQHIKSDETMALVRCEPTMRFLLPNYLNLFACHEERLGELREKFQEPA